MAHRKTRHAAIVAVHTFRLSHVKKRIFYARRLKMCIRDSDLIKKSASELLEASLPDELEEQIVATVKADPLVSAVSYTHLKGWKAPQCAGVIHTDFEKG